MSKRREIVFNISQNFRILHVLGEGSFGVVCLAIHVPTGTKVAIKKVVPFNRHLFCLRTLREIKLLAKFRHHENIVQLFDIQKPLDFDHFDEVYLIQEYMPSDLHKIIVTQPLTEEHVRYFTYQLLRGLKYIHSANVIHRDLKPANVLVNNNCDLKICDFGLARIDNNLDRGNVSALTEYVATRWYRAPEVMLAASQYSIAMDLWSVGCILAELFSGKPLLPGKDYRHQLLLLFQLLGTPKIEDMAFIRSRRATAYIQILPKYSPLDFQRYFLKFPSAHPLGIDLLSKLLVFDPLDRYTVQEALEHPYLAVYHDPGDEPSTDSLLVDEFDFDSRDQTILDLKKELYSSIMTLNG